MKRAMLFSVFIKVYMQYTIYYVIFYAIHVLAMSVGYNSLSTHVNYNLFCIAQKEMQDYQSTTTTTFCFAGPFKIEYSQVHIKDNPRVTTNPYSWTKVYIYTKFSITSASVNRKYLFFYLLTSGSPII